MSQYPVILPGGKLPNSARTQNSVIDAARQNEARPRPQAPGSFIQNRGSYSEVLVRNDSGSDVALYGVLGHRGSVVITQTANAAEFNRRVTLIGEEPEVSTHDNQPLIALEPIANGSFGRCAIGGMVQCQVNVNHEDHVYADIKDADLTQLESAEHGSARIYPLSAGTGTIWCIVHLGIGVHLNQLFPVSLTNPTGTNGNAAGAADYVYDVTGPAGSSITTALDPTAAPHSHTREWGPVNTATFGTGYFQVNSGGTDIEFVLHWFNETFQAEVCS